MTGFLPLSFPSLCPFLLCPSPSIYILLFSSLSICCTKFFFSTFCAECMSWISNLNVETLRLIGCLISENTRALIKKQNFATHYCTEMGRKIECNHLWVYAILCVCIFLCIRTIVLFISFTCICMCVICLCSDLVMHYFQE